MAGASLLALLDDIASVLDDVAAMTQVAARKTAGVLGDDLALNAQQVSGVKPERELPVVWAVARGSFRNKLILVPAALAISVLAPWAIAPLLVAGGLYLCFEGIEKLAHRWIESDAHAAVEREALARAAADPSVDLVAFERDKIRGAVRTDFILSAEIIVIALGAATGAPLGTQFLVLAGIALAMTVGVYGLVAGIVKLDDLGLHLSERPDAWARALGRGVLRLAPWLMRFLSVAGTAAMFLVGGGILTHEIPALHHAVEAAAGVLIEVPGIGGWLGALGRPLLDALAGAVAGTAVLAGVTGVRRLRRGR
jgi:predicted DNA repair protein MutK